MYTRSMLGNGCHATIELLHLFFSHTFVLHRMIVSNNQHIYISTCHFITDCNFQTLIENPFFFIKLRNMCVV